MSETDYTHHISVSSIDTSLKCCVYYRSLLSIGDNFGEDWAYWLVIGHTICGDPCPMVELPTAANQFERQRRVDHQEYALGHCFYQEHLEEMMRLRQERISAATDELLHKLRVVDEANGRELARWNNAAAPVVVWRGYSEPTACG